MFCRGISSNGVVHIIVSYEEHSSSTVGEIRLNIIHLCGYRANQLYATELQRIIVTRIVITMRNNTENIFTHSYAMLMVE